MSLILARIYPFVQPKAYKKIASGCEKVLTLQNSVQIKKKIYESEYETQINLRKSDQIS